MLSTSSCPVLDEWSENVQNEGDTDQGGTVHTIPSTACHLHHTLNIGKYLFDVDAGVGVIVRGAGGSGIARFERGLGERAVVHTPLFHHHILRLTQSRVTPRFPELLGRRREVLAASHVHVLGLLFPLRLPVVEVIEVGDNHRDWQSDGQDTSDGTERPHDLAPYGHRVHIPVTYCRHGYHCPPEGIRDTAKT